MRTNIRGKLRKPSATPWSKNGADAGASKRDWVRLAISSGDRKKMEEATAALNDRLLNFAYLL